MILKYTSPTPTPLLTEVTQNTQYTNMIRCIQIRSNTGVAISADSEEIEESGAHVTKLNKAVAWSVEGRKISIFLNRKHYARFAHNHICIFFHIRLGHACTARR